MPAPLGTTLRRLMAAIGIAVLAAFAMPTLSTRAAAQTFTRIADTQTVIPGGGGRYSLFADARSIDADSVAFYAFHDGGGSGIYLFRDGGLSVIADTGTPVPGTSDTFTTFFDVSVDRGFVVFTGGWPGPGGGCAFSGSEGVFARKKSGGAVRTIVTSLTEPENCYHGVEFAQGVIAIGGGIDPVDVFHNHSESILATKRPGNANVFFDTTTPKPGGGTFAGYDQDLAIRGGALLFAEVVPNTVGAVAGIYTVRNDGAGPVRVVDDSTLIPGTTETFNNIASADWDGTEVGFVGRDSGNRTALYAGTSPADLRVVVDRTTPVPGQGVNFLGLSNPMAYDAGVFAFSGFWAGSGAGLFTESSGEVEAVLVKGDLLDGRTVDQAFCRPQNKRGDRLIADVRFQNGDRGLYLVDLGASGAR